MFRWNLGDSLKLCPTGSKKKGHVNSEKKTKQKKKKTKTNAFESPFYTIFIRFAQKVYLNKL